MPPKISARALGGLLIFAVALASPRPAAAEPAASDPLALPAYELDLRIDVPVVLVAGLVQLGWAFSDVLAPPYCAPLCTDTNALPFLDRSTAGNYDERWARASDVGLYAVAAGSLATLLIDEGIRHGLNDALVVIEAVFVANATAIISSLATRRPRPLLYGTAAPEDERRKPAAALSFFSGHATTTSAATLATFMTLRRRRPGSWIPWAALAAGLGITAFVSVGRVMAGRHFPTDVLVGTAVGASVGIAVPALHAQPGLALRPLAVEQGAGLALRWTGI